LEQYAQILDISPDATDEEIHRAYRRLASTHHPDLGGDKDEFQKIQNAYERLLSLRAAAAKKRHYGAADVARKRNDELREERKRKAAAVRAAQQTQQREETNAEKDRSASTNNGEHHVRSTRPAARQYRYVQNLVTRKLPLQDETTMFIFINTLDIFMTYVLISLGAIEANPIANHFFAKYNFNGLIVFKLVIVAVVCLIAQVIAATSIRKGKTLLNFGSLLVGAVVAYSCWLLVDKFL
jgi:hypothetical protein